MELWLIVCSFIVIAVMRVAQKVCDKQVSNLVKGKTFFHYGGYYNLWSALFSLVFLLISGVGGLDFPTLLCALATAFFLALELFAVIESLKGTTLLVGQIFSVGGLSIPCIVGIFLFGETMSVWQWCGIALFGFSMYFMLSSTETKRNNETGKSSKISFKTMVMLLLMLISGGGIMTAQKAFGKLVPDGNVAAYSFWTFALNACVLYVCYFASLIAGKKNKTNGSEETVVKEKKSLPKVLAVCGVIVAFAIFMMNTLITELGRTVNSAILFSVSYAISIVITILVGAVCYKEKITWKHCVGLVLCVCSLAIINFL